MQKAIPTASRIPVSALHQVHRAVLNRGSHTLGLHVGEPAMGMPEVAIEAIARAVRDGKTGYGDAPGLPELRARLAHQFAADGCTPAEVFVSMGSCQGIAAVLLSLSVPGASVLLPELHWPTHRQQIVMAGMCPRFFVNGLGTDLAAELERAYDPSVRVAIINSPANPSGAVISREACAEVHRWALERGVWIISDEAYVDFVFEGDRPCLGALDSQVEERDRKVFSVRTFSKGYSFTGCRLGYLAAPNREAAERLRRVQEACIITPSSPIQWGGLAALDATDHLGSHHRRVRATRDAVLERLQGSVLLGSAPAGGWYMMLDVSALCQSIDQFCSDLLARTGVAVAPGDAFVAPEARLPRMVRVALCVDHDLTIEAIDRLRAYCETVGEPASQIEPASDLRSS
jgi:aspartate aminotransferase